MLEAVVCGLANHAVSLAGRRAGHLDTLEAKVRALANHAVSAGRMARRSSRHARGRRSRPSETRRFAGRTTCRSSRYVGGRPLRPAKSRRFAGRTTRRSSRYAGGRRLQGLRNHAVRCPDDAQTSRYVGGRHSRPGEIAPFRWPDDSQVISIRWRPSFAALANHVVSQAGRLAGHLGPVGRVIDVVVWRRCAALGVLLYITTIGRSTMLQRKRLPARSLTERGRPTPPDRQTIAARRTGRSGTAG